MWRNLMMKKLFGAQCRHSCVAAYVARNANNGMKIHAAHLSGKETYVCNVSRQQDRVILELPGNVLRSVLLAASSRRACCKPRAEIG